LTRKTGRDSIGKPTVRSVTRKRSETTRFYQAELLGLLKYRSGYPTRFHILACGGRIDGKRPRLRSISPEGPRRASAFVNFEVARSGLPLGNPQ